MAFQLDNGILVININHGKGLRVMPEEKKEPLTEWITTQEAAEIMGVTQTTVSRLCGKGKLTCEQYGESYRSIWMVERKSAENYKRDLGGRPRNKKKSND